MIDYNVVKVLFASIFAVVFSQLLSSFLFALKEGKFSFKDLYGTGGFPSSHSAFVSCLTVSVYIVQGFSMLFVVCFVFSMIILRDAVGVRNEVGLIAAELNRIKKKQMYNESAGHTLVEMIGGVFFGILIAVLFFIF